MGSLTRDNSPRCVGMAVVIANITAGVITSLGAATYHGLIFNSLTAGVLSLDFAVPRPDTGYASIISPVNAAGLTLYPSGGRTATTCVFSSNGAFTGTVTLNIAVFDA